VSILWHSTIYTLFYVQPDDGFSEPKHVALNSSIENKHSCVRLYVITLLNY